MITTSSVRLILVAGTAAVASFSICSCTAPLPSSPSQVPIAREPSKDERHLSNLPLTELSPVPEAPAPKVWGDRVLLNPDTGGYAMFPQVDVDRSGNAVAVWYTEKPNQGDILVARYDAKARHWERPVVLEGSSEDARAPSVAITDSGDAAVIWRQNKAGQRRIYARYHDARSDRWGDAVLIDVDSRGESNSPIVAAAGNDLVAAWERSDERQFVDDERISVYANRYDGRTGQWGDAMLLGKATVADARIPDAIGDSKGNAVVAWYQSHGGLWHIYASRYDDSAGKWAGPTRIDADGPAEAMFPQVAIDSASNAHVVWEQRKGRRLSIKANHWNSATGRWGDVVTPQPESANAAASPSISAGGDGRATITWQQYDGSWMSIYASRYNPVLGEWSPAAQLETENSGSAFSSRVAMDDEGGAFVVWKQEREGHSGIVVNQFDVAENSWGTALSLEADDEGDADWPDLAVSRDGRAVVVWKQQDGKRNNIYACWYDQVR